MRVYSNRASGQELFITELPYEQKADVAPMMAYRGLLFSTTASKARMAVLFSPNPYALCDLDGAEAVPTLVSYKAAIEASRALRGKRKSYKTPPGMEMWDYQQASLDYVLERQGGIIADEPGLGKTPMAIVFCNEVDARRVLVIVPASVRIQWGERIKEWSTIPKVSVSVMLNAKDGIHPNAHYQVISYDAARNPAIMRAIAKGKWDVLICDEAHKMKNAEALVTRAILGNRDKNFVRGGESVPCISTYCRRTLALTGTPLLNRPSEAYVLFRHFDWESIDYATEDAFKFKYNKQALMKTLEGKRFNLESTALELELQNRLRVNVMARHEKKDVLTLMKPPLYSVVSVQANGDVQKALAVEGMLGLSVEEIQTTKDFEILGHIAEARRLMGEAIAPQVADYGVDFLEGSDEKLVIFCWHLSVIQILSDALHDYGVVTIHGGKSANARNQAIQDFVTKPAIRVIILNMQAGGEGVDGLQHVASRCYLAEPEWVPSRNTQAVARLDRIGQKGIVTAEVFMAPGSVAEKILLSALKKLNVIHRTLDERDLG